MGLTLKQNRKNNDVIKGNPLPLEIIAPIPERVLERFPELEDWARENDKRWQDAVDALERRSVTAQKFTVPVVTSDPANPETGQMWLLVPA